MRKTFTILVSYADRKAPHSYDIEGETLSMALAKFLVTPQLVNANVKSITDVTPAAVEKKRTTARELVESIMSYQLDKLRKSRLQASDMRIRAESHHYEDMAAFRNYLLTFEGRKEMSFFITEKQASFLRSLLDKEHVNAVNIDGLLFHPTNPSVLRGGYGGTRGKVKDNSKHILKVEVASDLNSI